MMEMEEVQVMDAKVFVSFNSIGDVMRMSTLCQFVTLNVMDYGQLLMKLAMMGTL